MIGELIREIVFAGLGGMVIVSALLVASLKNILHAAVALFFCLAGVAGLYILLGADFVGAAQLVIYAGGILVLIIFGIFLTARIYNAKVEFAGPGAHRLVSTLIALGVFAISWMVIGKTSWPTKELVFEPTTAKIGTLFLTKYLLPFELVSILLLFAMIGAVILVRKEMGEGQ